MKLAARAVTAPPPPFERYIHWESAFPSPLSPKVTLWVGGPHSSGTRLHYRMVKRLVDGLPSFDVVHQSLPHADKIHPAHARVIVLRDPVATAASQDARFQLLHTPAMSVTLGWLQCGQLIERSRSATLVVHYEDTIDHPEATMAKLAGFIGVPTVPVGEAIYDGNEKWNQPNA